MTSSSSSSSTNDDVPTDDKLFHDNLTIGGWISIGLLIVLAILLIYVERNVGRTGGKKILYHCIFATCAVLACLFIPNPVHGALFSPLGIIIVGTVYPIYESIRAVCTPQESDDKVWLQYWIAQGIIYYSTEWIDDLPALKDNERIIHYYEFEFIFFCWLMLPYTDGSTLIFDYITEPYLVPLIKPLQSKMTNLIQDLVALLTNATHLFVLWFIFMILPPSWKRFATLSVGVIYPLLSSIIAVTTPYYDDDTFWLTYWSCYGCLYLLMDFTETWIGWIPGFYTAILFTSVYLMLPMFNGADKFFRKVLVPLAGLQEMMLLRDTLKIKKDIISQLPPNRRKALQMAIANSFTRAADDEVDDDDKDSDPLMLHAYYSNQTVPSIHGGSTNNTTSSTTYQSV